MYVLRMFALRCAGLSGEILCNFRSEAPMIVAADLALVGQKNADGRTSFVRDQAMNGSLT